MLYWLSGFLPLRTIEVDGRPYLECYYIGQLFCLTLYLHRFITNDAERHLHNHPWNAFAIILKGWYIEEVALDICPHAGQGGTVIEERHIGWFNRITCNKFHRIIAVKPNTWTLVIHGSRAKLPDGQLKGWGFLESRGPLETVFRTFSTRADEWWKTATRRRDQ